MVNIVQVKDSVRLDRHQSHNKCMHDPASHISISAHDPYVKPLSRDHVLVCLSAHMQKPHKAVDTRSLQC